MNILKLKEKQDKAQFLEQVWNILEASYRQVPGGLHFSCPAEMLADTDEWHLIIENNQVQALTLHKYRHGLKLVALGKSRASCARAALKQLICHALQHGWMELSDQAEVFVMRECEGHRFILHASLAAQLLRKTIFPAEQDGFHYRRHIMGMLKTKLILGTPNMTAA